MIQVNGSGVVATLIKPAPARISGPRVVSDKRTQVGEVDAKEIGQRIDPQQYAANLQRAKERARQHR